MKKYLIILLTVLLCFGAANADTLLYRQQFDVAHFEDLAWEITDSNTQCELKEGTLYINHYAPEDTLGFSCLPMLTAEQLQPVIRNEFTVQYDVNYETTSDSNGFLGLMLGNADSGVLPVLTARGKARLYTVQGGKLTELQSESVKETVLNGRKSVSNLWVSVRISVQNNTVSVSMRVPENNTDWIDVLSATVTVRDGVCLAFNGTQKGNMDNILIYNGSVEPAVDEVTAIRYRGSCLNHQWIPATCEVAETCSLCGEKRGDVLPHAFDDAQDSGICLTCGRTRDAIENDWLLEGVPAYVGGVKASALYNAGQGIDPAQPAEKDIYLAAVSETCREEYEAYLVKLGEKSYAILKESEQDGNCFADLYRDGENLHLTYCDYNHSVKIIQDTASTGPVSDFGYTCQGDNETVVYQVGLPMAPNGFTYGHINSDGTVTKQIDCGMMYVVRLSDNSLFIIDGGAYQQFDEAQIDATYAFLREITGNTDEKIHISCWYFTHGHQDHHAGMCRMMAKYHDQFSLERVMNNFPSANTDEYISIYKTQGMLKLYAYLRNWFGSNITFQKAHTGQQFHLADISIDVLYTHEDNIDLKTGMSLITSDENNASTVLMMTFSGKKFLILGDINQPASYVVQSLWDDSTLKCDMLQLAHHGINFISSLYSRASPELVLAPVTNVGAHRNYVRASNMESLEKNAKSIIYAPEGTVGITVRDGEFVKVYEAPVAGGDYDGIWKY